MCDEPVAIPDGFIAQRRVLFLFFSSPYFSFLHPTETRPGILPRKKSGRRLSSSCEKLNFLVVGGSASAGLGVSHLTILHCALNVQAKKQNSTNLANYDEGYVDMGPRGPPLFGRCSGAGKAAGRRLASRGQHEHPEGPRREPASERSGASETTAGWLRAGNARQHGSCWRPSDLRSAAGGQTD